jgi:hypothetical protein
MGKKIDNFILNAKRRIKQAIVPILLSFFAGLTIGLLSYYFNHNVMLSGVITLGVGFIAYVIFDSMTMVTEMGWM